MAIAITTSSTNPLSDSNSFLFQKTGGANDQGKGVSYDFTVDSASKAKVMKISFDYIVNSGTFTAGGIGPSGADSDVIVYVYDITNSQLIQPSSFKLFSNSSTIPDSYSGYFQTSYNSTSYRLIFHQATTTTNNFELKIDSIKVERANYQYGTPITDWASYIPTFTGFGSVSVSEFEYRRVGSACEIRGRFTSGTSTATEARISLPSGLTSTSCTAIRYVGGGVKTGATASYFTMLSESLTSYLTVGMQNATNSGLTKQLGSTLVGSSDGLAITATIPILGWSSCVQMSDSTTQQVVTAIANGTPANVTSGNPIIYPTIINDTTGSYNATTGRFTVPVAGYWQVSMAAVASVATTVPINIYKNAVQNLMIAINTTGNVSGFGMVYANAGDILDVRPVGSGITSFSATTNYNSISFTRVSGPASIAATDTVAASYYASANTTASTSAPYNFDTKIYDSHSAVTVGSAWKFTAPTAGVYSGSTYINASSAPAYILLYKNGSFYMALGYGPLNAISTLPFDVKLNSGDYIEVRASASSTGNGGVLASNLTSWFSIKKIGLL